MPDNSNIAVGTKVEGGGYKGVVTEEQGEKKVVLFRNVTKEEQDKRAQQIELNKQRHASQDAGFYSIDPRDNRNAPTKERAGEAVEQIQIRQTVPGLSRVPMDRTITIKKSKEVPEATGEMRAMNSHYLQQPDVMVAGIVPIPMRERSFEFLRGWEHSVGKEADTEYQKKVRESINQGEQLGTGQFSGNTMSAKEVFFDIPRAPLAMVNRPVTTTTEIVAFVAGGKAVAGKGLFAVPELGISSEAALGSGVLTAGTSLGIASERKEGRSGAESVGAAAFIVGTGAIIDKALPKSTPETNIEVKLKGKPYDFEANTQDITGKGKGMFEGKQARYATETFEGGKFQKTKITTYDKGKVSNVIDILKQPNEQFVTIKNAKGKILSETFEHTTPSEPLGKPTINFLGRNVKQVNNNEVGRHTEVNVLESYTGQQKGSSTKGNIESTITLNNLDIYARNIKATEQVTATREFDVKEITRKKPEEMKVGEVFSKEVTNERLINIDSKVKIDKKPFVDVDNIGINGKDVTLRKTYKFSDMTEEKLGDITAQMYGKEAKLDLKSVGQDRQKPEIVFGDKFKIPDDKHILTLENDKVSISSTKVPRVQEITALYTRELEGTLTIKSIGKDKSGYSPAQIKDMKDVIANRGQPVIEVKPELPKTITKTKSVGNSGGTETLLRLPESSNKAYAVAPETQLRGWQSYDLGVAEVPKGRLFQPTKLSLPSKSSNNIKIGNSISGSTVTVNAVKAESGKVTIPNMKGTIEPTTHEPVMVNLKQNDIIIPSPRVLNTPTTKINNKAEVDIDITNDFNFGGEDIIPSPPPPPPQFTENPKFDIGKIGGIDFPKISGGGLDLPDSQTISRKIKTPKYGYTPSMEAELFNIHGKKGKAWRTGLTVRPL